MNKAIRQWAFKKHLFKLIISVLIAVLIIFGFGKNFRNILVGPKLLFGIEPENMKNQYVYIDNVYIFDYFGDLVNESDNVVTSHFYIIPYGDSNLLMGLELDSDYFEKAEILMNEIYAYMNYETDQITSSFAIKGKLMPIEGKLKEYFYSWIIETNYYGTSDMKEIEKYAIPYMVKADTIEGVDNRGVLISFIALMGLFIFIAYNIFDIYYYSNVKFIKQIKKYETSHDVTYDSAVAEFEATSKFDNLYISDRFIYILEGKEAKLYLKKDIIWAYIAQSVYHPTNRNLNFIFLVFVFSSREKQIIKITKQESIEMIFELLKQHNPSIIFGYSEVLQELFEEDLDKFLMESINE